MFNKVVMVKLAVFNTAAQFNGCFHRMFFRVLRSSTGKVVTWPVVMTDVMGSVSVAAAAGKLKGLSMARMTALFSLRRFVVARDASTDLYPFLPPCELSVERL